MEYGGDVIDRMKAYISAESDTDLAADLGVRRNAVAQWRHRNSIPLEHVVAFSNDHDVSLDWLLRGSGEKYGFGGRPANKDNPVHVRYDSELLSIALRTSLEVHRGLFEDGNFDRFSECLAWRYEEVTNLYAEWSKLGVDREGILTGLRRSLLTLTQHNATERPGDDDGTE